MPKRSLLLLAAALALAACSGGDAAPDTTTLPTSTLTAPTTSVGSEDTTTSAPPTTSTTTTTTTTTVAAVPVTIDVAYADGDVEGPTRPEVAVGTIVRLLVTSDIEDEVHLHGYNITADVAPDTAALIEFLADTPGIYEVELEGEGVLLVEIEVR